MNIELQADDSIQNKPSTAAIVPRQGVITLFGYGIQARVDRGHLLLEDGIGAERRRARLSRIGHGLKRLVVIGSDGMVSLAALRWLADQNASFVMLERDGKVLTTTGPVRSSDARLRCAQSLGSQSGTALRIARELIEKKLLGQELVARNKLLDVKTADAISSYRAQLAQAETPERIRLIESRAAGAYWAIWHNLPINFPRKDQPRVPEHWRRFGNRVSPLTGSPRLAINPPNAILNYRKLAEAALASVSGKLIEAQEQERSRIGRELHDDIGQRLALLTIELHELHNDPLILPGVRSRTGELQKQISEIAADIQSLSHELHSAKLQYLGIAGAIRGFCREFGEQQKVEINCQTHDLPSPLSPDISLCFFRVLQEALHNAVKHSRVRHFEVRLWGTSEEIRLTVRDSGIGFDRETVKESGGLGLISMEERLKLLKGTFSVESEPEGGTTIHARVPLSSDSKPMRAAG